MAASPRGTSASQLIRYLHDCHRADSRELAVTMRASGLARTIPKALLLPSWRAFKSLNWPTSPSLPYDRGRPASSFFEYHARRLSQGKMPLDTLHFDARAGIAAGGISGPASSHDANFVVGGEVTAVGGAP